MSVREETQQRFEKEKQAYWAMREELLKKYPGKWVGVVNGQVVAVGDKMGKVMEEAYRKTESKVMFVSEVGNEDRIRRLRHVSIGGHDLNYDPAMPTITVPVSDVVEAVSIDVEFIVDTGADLTVLQDKVAAQLNLLDAPAGLGYVAGVGAKPEQRRLYGAFVHIANQKIMIAADCRDDFRENLLGRDAINEFELTVCAKRNLVRFAWLPDESV